MNTFTLAVCALLGNISAIELVKHSNEVTFLQMTDGSVKAVDAVDDTMNMIAE